MLFPNLHVRWMFVSYLNEDNLCNKLENYFVCRTAFYCNGDSKPFRESLYWTRNAATSSNKPSGLREWLNDVKYLYIYMWWHCCVPPDFTRSSCTLMSVLCLGEELLPPLCADEKTQFPWQQSNLHRHGLVLFVVYVVEAGGALLRLEKVLRHSVVSSGMCAPSQWGGSEKLWRFYLRQL